ncbi:hypothetical protein DC31_00040 [Microbacterium sp. CH12i]|uniref:hypothetical protein n=1 Tax=Microbacterium sp. CH12i TaxID=1479651 RepID=UPI000461076C|nr:hypothetical protein [Microbacterium sp. CH12i]KDA07169.1 hypothetical protein DC31_00040 [Microbacterium sp. CH12i]
MDLITTTWTSDDANPLAIGALVVGFFILFGGLFATAWIAGDKGTRTTKRRAWAWITGTTIAIVGLGLIIPGFITPRVTNTNTHTQIEATGTIDSISPLNRGGYGIRLTDNLDILLNVNEDDSDQYAGLEGHEATLYCTTPNGIDSDHTALAAGTILTCSPNRPTPESIFGIDIPHDDDTDARTALTISGGTK